MLHRAFLLDSTFFDPAARSSICNHGEHGNSRFLYLWHDFRQSSRTVRAHNGHKKVQ